MYGIRVSHFGGPEVLEFVELDDPVPGPGQVLIDVTIAGVNYLDVNRRSGPTGDLPFFPGIDGAGTVLAVGPDVTDVAVGDRVVWKSARGSYAERVLVAQREAVSIPEAISDEIAAAAMLQGLTAHYLASSAHPIVPGETALIHAAAGGVGLMLTQIVKLRGGSVIATVSTEEKEHLAREAGADIVIRYDLVDFADEVHRTTDGAGVSVVYDGVGDATFEGSLASLARRGMLVLFGGASGHAARSFDLQRLGSPRSLFVTRPSLDQYTASRDELMARSDELFGWILRRELEVRIGGEYPLGQAAKAHEALQGRMTTGKLLLRPHS